MVEITKGQDARLFDVFVIGPTLIYASTQKELSATMQDLLLVFGLGIVLYNGARFIANLQAPQS